MGLALGITLFAITGGIMVGYVIACQMVLDQVEPHMKKTKSIG